MASERKPRVLCGRPGWMGLTCQKPRGHIGKHRAKGATIQIWWDYIHPGVEWVSRKKRKEGKRALR